MEARPLAVPGAFEFTPKTYGDDRGAFLEWFKADVVQRAVGRPLGVVQANHSVSRRGVIRGLHFADVPPSQAKYVYCPHGTALDVVIDIRVGSPTFGSVDTVRIDDVDRRGVYVAEGLGHAFMALTDDTHVTYLCSVGYTPGREHGVNPLDPGLAISWPDDIEPVLSDKDRAAPTLAEADAAGLLPTYAECLAFYASGRGRQ